MKNSFRHSWFTQKFYLIPIVFILLLFQTTAIYWKAKTNSLSSRDYFMSFDTVWSTCLWEWAVRSSFRWHCSILSLDMFRLDLLEKPFRLDVHYLDCCFCWFCYFMIVWSSSVLHVSIYTLCPGKKRPKCYFCNISYKTQAILMKVGTLFPVLICCKMM